jgi:hypothetical protein
MKKVQTLVSKVKDYLSAKERNDFLTIMYMVIMQDRMLKSWVSKGALTKEEITLLKKSRTWTNKFNEKVKSRLSRKEVEYTDKKIDKFDVRFFDDYTIQKIFRDMSNRLENATIPRPYFTRWCEEIMDVNCRQCTKSHCECYLNEMFEENLVESDTGEELPNCRYAYTSKRPRYSAKEISDYMLDPRKPIEEVDKFIDKLDAASMRAMLKDSAREWTRMAQEQSK